MPIVEWHERCLWPTIERLKAQKMIDRNGKLADHCHVVTSDADAVAVAVAYIVSDVLEHVAQVR